MEILTTSVKEASRGTGLSIPTIYRMINRGELKTQKVGARRLINVASLKQVTGAA